MARLLFLETPSREPLSLEAREYSLGRRPENSIRLEFPTVSQKHAVLQPDGNSFSVTDLASTNGTFVNGERLEPNRPRRLHHDDILQLGETRLQFDNPAARRQRENGNPLLQRSNPGRSSVPGVLTDEPANITSTLDGSTRFGGMETNPEAKLRAVLAISSDLSGAHGLSEVLPAIMDSLFQIFRYADRGCILLKDEETGELVPRAMKHRNPGRDETIRLSRTIVRDVIESRQGILSTDVGGDYRGVDSIADLKIHSLMCVPMLSAANEPIGIISIDSQNPLGQFSQDDLDILLSVAGQAALAYENARLFDSFVEKQKQDNELEIARGVQRALLPDQFPKVEGYEFFASYDSAQMVGGDYYDVLRLPEGKICFSFGDVAGKGVPGALIMSRMHSCVQSTLKHVFDVEEAMNAINEHMCDTAVEGRFVTYILAILDPATGALTVSNGGHMCPIIRHADGTIEQFSEDPVGPPIGVVDGYPYEVETRILAPGDVVVLVTDGVNDAMNPQGDFYGDDRVFEMVRQGPGEAASLGRALLADVRRHAAGRPQNDDIAIMTIGRNPIG